MDQNVGVMKVRDTRETTDLMASLMRDIVGLKFQAQKSNEGMKRLALIEERISELEDAVENMGRNLAALVAKLSTQSRAPVPAHQRAPQELSTSALSPEKITEVFNQALINGYDIRTTLRRLVPGTFGVTLVTDDGLEKRVIAGQDYRPRLQADKSREPFFLAPIGDNQKYGLLFPSRQLDAAYIKYVKVCFKTDRESGRNGSITVKKVIAPASCESREGEWQVTKQGYLSLD